MMLPAEALTRADEFLKSARLPLAELHVENFLDYATVVADVVKALPGRDREALPWLKDWALTWRQMHDSFDTIAAADPMVMYRPAHQTSEAFHASNAFVRYFCAGNRTSKTQSGYAEHYFTATNQNKWRTIHAGAHSSFIIGVNFSKYCPAVFERKFLTGEDGNHLSPMFPPKGKWFYKYDERKHIISIACRPCAEAGKARSCGHRKSTITLFSDTEGIDVLMGGQYILGHFDEHISEEFFNESIQRTQTVKDSGLIITGTPLNGTDAWEQTRLVSKFLNGGSENRIIPEDPASPQFVEVFEISQFDAGLVPEEKVRMAMASMDDFEIESRIYGRAAPLAKNPVFDRRILAEMRKAVREPARGSLSLIDGVDLYDLQHSRQVEFMGRETAAAGSSSKAGGEDAGTELRVWEEPVPGETYIIGVDTAKGLSGRGDYSCASVLRVSLFSGGPKLQLVAQWHGHVNPFDYAEHIFKLAVWYSDALVAIELTGGYGEATMQRLRREFVYWNIFRDQADPSLASATLEAKFGVETNIRTKPYMVAALQQFIKDRAIALPCIATLSELVAFEQERSDSGLTTRYRGAKGAKDDRVMSLAIGVSVALSANTLDVAMNAKQEARPIEAIYQGEWLKIHRELQDHKAGVE